VARQWLNDGTLAAAAWTGSSASADATNRTVNTIRAEAARDAE
jgi:hypothetical protein